MWGFHTFELLAIHPSNHVNSDVHTKNKFKKKEREYRAKRKKKSPILKTKLSRLPIRQQYLD